MRESTITGNAFGLALLVHGLLFVAWPTSVPMVRLPQEPIAVTFAAPPLRQEVTASPKAAAIRAEPCAVFEKEIQNQKTSPVVKPVVREMVTPRTVADLESQPVPVRQAKLPVVEKRLEPPRQEVQPPRPGPGLPEYLAGVRTQVEAAREYPALARQMALQGTVIVRLTIAEDGSLAAVQVAASSGHASLARLAWAGFPLKFL